MKAVDRYRRWMDQVISCRNQLLVLTHKLEALAELLELSYETTASSTYRGLGYTLKDLADDLISTQIDVDGLQQSISKRLKTLESKVRLK
jgi:hypothetical protein